MSDYRLDPVSQTHAYAGYGVTKSRPMTPVDNYTKSNNPRQGIGMDYVDIYLICVDARPNSIGMNSKLKGR